MFVICGEGCGVCDLWYVVVICGVGGVWFKCAVKVQAGCGVVIIVEMMNDDNDGRDSPRKSKGSVAMTGKGK